MPTNTNGVLRLRPRINITRGYAGNEPHSITRSEALDSSAIDGSTSAKSIYSGQPIAFNGATGLWEPITYATDAAANARTAVSAVHFAFHDWNDTDVQSCDKLLGFSVLGKFEIETPWVDITTGTDLAVGDAVGIKVQTQADSTATAILAKVDYTNATSHNTTPQIGIVTEIRDLGVGGHTAGTYGTKYSGNARGGVATTSGTIPEDSTADSWNSGDSSLAMKIVKFVTQI